MLALFVIGVCVFIYFLTKNITKKSAENDAKFEEYLSEYLDPLVHDFSVLRVSGVAERAPILMISHLYPESNDINDYYKFYAIELFLYDTTFLYCNYMQDWNAYVESELFQNQAPQSRMFYKREIWKKTRSDNVLFRSTSNIPHPYNYCKVGSTFKNLGAKLQARYSTKYPEIKFSWGEAAVTLE